MRWRFAGWGAALLLGLSSLIAEPAPAHARRVVVRASGQGVIVNGNLQGAEAQATAAAYRQALAQVADGPKKGARAQVANSSLVDRRLKGSVLYIEMDVEIETETVRTALSAGGPPSLV